MKIFAALLLALLIPTTAAAAPTIGAITSPLVATATTGTPFTYTITVSGMGTTYAAQGLPAGLTYNASTGVISGTPNVSGTYTVTLAANQTDGEFLTARLALTVNPGGPTNNTPPPPAKMFCANDPNPACGVYLTWNAGSAPATPAQATIGYLVFRGISASSAAYTQLTPNPIVASSYTDTTMAPSTSYTYYIVSVDAAGTQSTPSNTFTAAIAAAPSVPTPPTPVNLTGSVIN